MNTIFWLVVLSTGFGFSFLTFLLMSHKDGARISAIYWTFVGADTVFIGMLLYVLAKLRDMQ